MFSGESLMKHNQQKYLLRKVSDGSKEFITFPLYFFTPSEHYSPPKKKKKRVLNIKYEMFNRKQEKEGWRV